MIKNADMPAMPTEPLWIENFDNPPGETVARTGLTKREHFAGLAMHGLLSNPNYRGACDDVAIEALEHADELLLKFDEL